MDFIYEMLIMATGFVLLLSIIIAFFLRRVVPTNEVHIVQTAKSTTSYGNGTGHGNTYYEWPSFLPIFGVSRVALPMSVFDLDLVAYEAYDLGRLPFVVDVKAFFRITDSNIAAQRVASFSELKEQLLAIVQGAVRVVLASNDIETILQGRASFGEQFTKEVAEQLTNWGVSAVKNIELMDIRDSSKGQVINSIMEKKKSFIDMESRTEVAKNHRMAQIAEIEANKEVQLQNQEAAQAVSIRTIQAQKEVQIRDQEKIQAVKEQERLTKEKDMAILQVQHVRTAEIKKQTQVIEADQKREVMVIDAEASRSATVIGAEGDLEAKRKEAEGITLEGQARASAEKAMQLAPVEAQIVLAKEIGTNDSYQRYLVTIRQVEATESVGKAQAEALKAAEIKVIANGGTVPSGVNSLTDMFTSNGGTQIGAMLEGLANTDVGAAILGRTQKTTKETRKE